MRLEHLDKLAASVHSSEVAVVPRVQRTPVAGGSVFGQALFSQTSEPEARKPVESVGYRREDIERAVEDANVLAETFPDHRISFAMDDGSEELVVRVVDNMTEEVVRQVPPQEFLELVSKVQQLMGLFFDELA